VISRKALKRHWKAMEWWKDQPEGTRIWCKMPDGYYPYYMSKWHLQSDPLWSSDAEYVINDEFAELRKAIADKKKIEVYNEDKWQPIEMVFSAVPTDPNTTFFEDLSKHGWNVSNFRVKKEKGREIKKNDFMIVEFLSEDTFKVLFIFDKEKAKKEYNKTFTLGESYEIGNEVTLSDARKKYKWEDVPYNEKNKLWDGQPVFICGNNIPFSRTVRFYDAVDNSFFYDDAGERNVTPNLIDNEYSWEPYPHLDDEWVIKAYRRLKF